MHSFAACGEMLRLHAHAEYVLYALYHIHIHTHPFAAYNLHCVDACVCLCECIAGPHYLRMLAVALSHIYLGECCAQTSVAIVGCMLCVDVAFAGCMDRHTNDVSRFMLQTTPCTKRNYVYIFRFRAASIKTVRAARRR